MAFDAAIDAGGELFSRLLDAGPLEAAIDAEAKELSAAATNALEHGGNPAKAVKEAHELLNLMRECGVDARTCGDLAKEIKDLEEAIADANERKIAMYLDRLRWTADEIDRINIT